MSMALAISEVAARAEICRVGRSLFERGYVHASAGNISVRLADGYQIRDFEHTELTGAIKGVADVRTIRPNG